MGLVSAILDKWTSDKAQSHAKEQAEREIALEEFIQAGAEGRELSRDESKAFERMLEREQLRPDDFKQQVAARVELIAATAEVQECNAAQYQLRELTAEQNSELAARKPEDDRRKAWDDQHKVKLNRAYNKFMRIEYARERLRKALPTGEQSKLIAGRAAMRATQNAINDLKKVVEKEVDLVSQLVTPSEPLPPIDHNSRNPDQRFRSQYDRQLEDYRNIVRSHQRLRDDLAGMQARLATLQETLKQQEAEYTATENHLLFRASVA